MHTLNVYMPAIHIGHLNRDYSDTTRYSRENKATDFSYVKKKVGAIPETIPYGTPDAEPENDSSFDSVGE